MPVLFFLLSLFVLPALVTWGLVRLLQRHAPHMARRRILGIAIPSGALLPLLPACLSVAKAQMIDNPVAIAIAGTLLAGGAVALFVCLPVALALTRR